MTVTVDGVFVVGGHVSSEDNEFILRVFDQPVGDDIGHTRILLIADAVVIIALGAWIKQQDICLLYTSRCV